MSQKPKRMEKFEEYVLNWYASNGSYDSEYMIDLTQKSLFGSYSFQTILIGLKELISLSSTFVVLFR